MATTGTSRAKKVAKLLSLPELATAAAHARELGKKHYARADRFVADLAARLATEKVSSVEMPGGKVARVKDNWEGKTTSFTPAVSRRYELEIKDV